MPVTQVYLIFLSPSFGKLFKYFFVVHFYPLFLGVMKYDQRAWKKGKYNSNQGKTEPQHIHYFIFIHQGFFNEPTKWPAPQWLACERKRTSGQRKISYRSGEEKRRLEIGARSQATHWLVG